jgi:hypothetical protein
MCQDLGPGAAVVELAERGLYPAMPLPTTPLDPSLYNIPITYLRAGNKPVRIYASAEDAFNGGNEVDEIPQGFVYLYYVDSVQSDDRKVYVTNRGFVRSGDAGDFKPPNYHGQAFSRTPERPFGWVISGTFASAAPESDLTEHWFSKFDVVQIFDVRRVGEWDWFQIGRNEWIEQRNVARVIPDPTPPAGVDSDKWISVNLYEQTITAYDHGQLVYATMVSTGRNGFWTRPGLFQVWAKLERDLMTGGIPGEEGVYYLDSVPWVLLSGQRAVGSVLRQGAGAARHLLARQIRHDDLARLRQPADDRRAVVLQLRRGGDLRLGLRSPGKTPTDPTRPIWRGGDQPRPCMVISPISGMPPRLAPRHPGPTTPGTKVLSLTDSCGLYNSREFHPPISCAARRNRVDVRRKRTALPALRHPSSGARWRGALACPRRPGDVAAPRSRRGAGFLPE